MSKELISFFDAYIVKKVRANHLVQMHKRVKWKAELGLGRGRGEGRGGDKWEKRKKEKRGKEFGLRWE